MIVGLGVPKWIGTGSPDTSTRILDYSKLEANYSEALLKVFESVLTGHRSYVAKWVHASFTITVNLWKYATPSTTASTLCSYLFKDVVFYPFKDGVTLGDGLGKPIKNSSSVNVNCRITNINFAPLNSTSKKWIAVITLQTNDPYDFSKLLQ